MTTIDQVVALVIAVLFLLALAALLLCAFVISTRQAESSAWLNRYLDLQRESSTKLSRLMEQSFNERAALLNRLMSRDYQDFAMTKQVEERVASGMTLRTPSDLDEAERERREREAAPDPMLTPPVGFDRSRPLTDAEEALIEAREHGDSGAVKRIEQSMRDEARSRAAALGLGV